jgi:hypothetical protein
MVSSSWGSEGIPKSGRVSDWRTLMSMCNIGYKINGVRKVANLHYSCGKLDWKKYHEAQEKRWKTELDTYPNNVYAQEQIAKSAQAKLGPDLSLDLTGCEEDAIKGGFWRCNTPEECLAWCKASDNDGGIEASWSTSTLALTLDFDAKHAVINDKENVYCDWEETLPDGWTKG